MSEDTDNGKRAVPEGDSEETPATPATAEPENRPRPGRRRLLLAGLLPLVLAEAVVATLGVTGRATFAYDRLPGRPGAILEEIPGPETGPVCPVDKRYVDEQPEDLRPDVRNAWDRLRARAEENGVRLCVQDGKRSVSQQQHEFDDAVRRFGTRELAAKYVLPPEKSMHVKGIAVDVQPPDSAAWVERNGGALGWCRRYQNEVWHFEYDPNYATAGCPALLPSATGS
ncbi:D-alanyl-D-alanine carboxypeptidase [Streptoalloteichus tenebrarius]|uniref:D-alanyl-D-alanine carboxypeptidase n=1 Tax=Streptoalloteichus tenebrarius (strain ATCC 17920 / DSM 40477 / JCM 4838 / CBS 697.72 / NBRC 16177 / NCIMB 11028 / NRRL B-12390 / A12253. 1 / ISP 5477) TaxID=1933 RepID=A0ABT1HMB1_STRSD|nr:D-alanyl-D-alanine carboxypeptidase family protein [Streptoalloteichus tenebrarius]MCP2256640.1 D-alanyl-D-alanine carboxypeptidase [Streptoalloteichus tenebrarius]